VVAGAFQEQEYVAALKHFQVAWELVDHEGVDDQVNLAA